MRHMVVIFLSFCCMFTAFCGEPEQATDIANIYNNNNPAKTLFFSAETVANNTVNFFASYSSSTSLIPVKLDIWPERKSIVVSKLKQNDDGTIAVDGEEFGLEHLFSFTLKKSLPENVCLQYMKYYEKDIPTVYQIHKVEEDSMLMVCTGLDYSTESEEFSSESEEYIATSQKNSKLHQSNKEIPNRSFSSVLLVGGSVALFLLIACLWHYEYLIKNVFFS